MWKPTYTHGKPNTETRSGPDSVNALLSPGTSATTFITFANFLPFSSFILVSADFFYSFSGSGLIHLPGNSATTYHQPTVGIYFTTMLQNPCRNVMTVTQQIATANLTTFVFLPFLGLISVTTHYYSHTINLRIQRVVSKNTGNRKWCQRERREKQKSERLDSVCF